MEKFISENVRDIRKQDVVKSFFESLKEVRKTKPYATQEEIIRHAVKSKAPRFYVTFENARRFVSLLSRKKKLPLINSNKLEMYKEIYHRYIKKVKDSSKRYKYIILEQIIEEPAPSFYLDEQTFRGILYKTLRAQ
ncbi:MAG: hypothetical protein J6V47_03330 [Bacteroidaceae bacterium]|nr:hypothetical protein [Bacteroidaceae bacterium]